MRKEILGYGAVVTAAVLWGVGGSVAKLMFNQAMSPFLLVKIRLTASFLLLALGLLFYDRHLLTISKKDIVYFASLGILGMSMVQFFYYFTMSWTNVATAVFLQYLAPVFMAAHAVFWEKTILGWRRGVAVALATLGGLLILLSSGEVAGMSKIGLVSGLMSAVFMAFNTVYGRRAVRQYQPITALVYSFGFGALFWWIIMPYTWEPGSITDAHWLMLAYVVVFSTVLPFLLYFIGMRFLPPTSVGVTACLEPVIAAVVAYFTLGETMGLLQIVGGAVIVFAVILLQIDSTAENLATGGS